MSEQDKKDEAAPSASPSPEQPSAPAQDADASSKRKKAKAAAASKDESAPSPEAPSASPSPEQRQPARPHHTWCKVVGIDVISEDKLFPIGSEHDFADSDVLSLPDNLIPL